MCRICGRTIKCIFDSMPSRTLTHHIPSRRAFTTLRTTRTHNLASRSPPSTSAPSLTRALSTLTLSPTTTAHRLPATNSLLTTASTTAHLLPSAGALLRNNSNKLRTFSTTAAVLGHRRRMDTFSPSRRVQKRRHGYLARLRSKSGRKTLKNRALRGRKALSW